MKFKIVMRGNKYLVTEALGRVVSDDYTTQEGAETERQRLISDSETAVTPKSVEDKPPVKKPRKARKPVYSVKQVPK